MTEVMSGFGPHLMLDCRQCDYDKINDLELVFNFLNDLPEKIGMTKITQPYVFPYSGLIPEDKGITGTVIIAESHLTFHSFVEKDYFFFDLFSCKPFDVEKAVALVVETFGVKDYERHQAMRGRYFPRTITERVHLVESTETGDVKETPAPKLIAV
ncbi:MAG: S-adenosylmethionine decarboxylase [Vampirovibrionales bacterium]|nr:S-adenosylmethionine decarboxylase [Vampirovibrionales bacterium]